MVRWQVLAALALGLASCGKSASDGKGGGGGRVYTGTITVDGKPRDMAACEPHYFDGVDLKLTLVGGEVITKRDSEDDALYLGDGFGPGDRYPCSSHAISAESGGDSATGVGFWHGHLAASCARGEGKTIEINIDLKCGDKPAKK